MNPWLRTVLLSLCLVPYVYFGLRDIWHHKTHRRVTFTEKLLHLTLGLTLATVVPHAYRGHLDVVIPGLLLFITARTIDEFVFHRGLDGAETDLHAKTHFSFLLFVIGFMGIQWLGQGGGAQ